MHPIVALQGALVSALKADSALAALVGEGVFDAAPRNWTGPKVVIMRHDVRAADADLAPAQEHRLLIHCWAGQPSRREALLIAERVVALALALTLVATDLVVTRRTHLRTETVIDKDTGMARAAVLLEFASE